MVPILNPIAINNWREQFDDMGHVTLSSLLNMSILADIAKHVNAVFDSWFETNKAEIMEYAMVNMHSLTHSDYFTERSSERIELFNVITPKILVEVINGIFGEGVHFHNTQLFFNPINGSGLPYWHRDMQYNPIDDAVLQAEQNNMTSLHVRIPLVDERGVELIPGTHKRWDTDLERKVRLEQDGHKNTEELPGSELIELTVGDVLIFDAQMIHRGNYVLNTERKALDLCLGRYHELSCSEFNQENQPSKKELNQIQNNDWFIHSQEIIKINQTNHLSGKSGG